MRSSLKSREGSKVTLEMEFDAVEFERNLALELRRALAEESDSKTARLAPEDLILSMAAITERRPDAASLLRRAVESTFDAHYDEVLDEYGVIPVSAPYLQPVAGEGGGAIGAVVVVETAPDIEGIRYVGLRVPYTEVVADGCELEAKLAAMRRAYGAESNDALLQITGSYDSVDDLLAETQRSIDARIAELNLIAKDEAAAIALVSANEIEVPEGEVAAYVEREIGKIAVQVGEEAFYERLSDGPHTMESVRAMIRRDVGHMPKLNRILGAIAYSRAFSVEDSDRLREIAAQRACSLEPDSMEPIEETLAAVKEDPALLRALDAKVLMNKAFDFAKENMVFEARMTVTLKERDPHAFR